jgi:hypothetical protein
MIAASRFHDITFYSYTKSLPYWAKGMKSGIIPSNYKLIASYGGTQDATIAQEGLKFAAVCFSEEEAKLFPSLSVQEFVDEKDEKDGKMKKIKNPKYDMLNRSFPLTGERITVDGKEVHLRSYSYKDFNGTWVTKTGIPICEDIDAEFEEDGDIDKFNKNGSDFPAYGTDIPFALLLHGTQPSGSVAATSISKINKDAQDLQHKQRVDFFVNKHNMKDLDANIEVKIRNFVVTNMESEQKSRRPSFDGKHIDLTAKKKKLINLIAKYLYNKSVNLPITSKVTNPKLSAPFLPEAYEKFDDRIDAVKKWAEGIDIESVPDEEFADDYGDDEAA